MMHDSRLLLFPALLLLLPSLASSLRCYQCDEFVSAVNKPCPGSSLINWGDEYDSCVIFRLSSGEIVFQSPAKSGRDHCAKSAAQLRDVIRENFGQSGTPMCCRSDGCNKDIPDSFSGNSLYLESTAAASSSSSSGGGNANEIRDDRSGGAANIATSLALAALIAGAIAAWRIL